MLCKMIKNKYYNNEFKIKILFSGLIFKLLDFFILTFSDFFKLKFVILFCKKWFIEK